MDEKKISEIALYTLKLIDQTISSEEFDELNSMISSDAQAARYYNQLMMAVYNFQEIGKELILDESGTDNALQKEFLESLAEYEKTAPEIENPKEKPQRELIQKVVYPPQEKRTITKFNIFVILNTAAAILLLLVLRFAPSKGDIEVAILTDSLNAKWANVEGEMVTGASISTSGESLLLSEGYAELLFNNQAKVTIQGPAEFKILTEDDIKLNYGRLYAVVPREAIGFTVKTPSAQIVDLGTEFGVDCGIHSDTSLHVIKGKTVLIAGDKSNKVSVEVKDGVAKKVFAATQTVSDIPCNDRLFVRDINSASNLIWRGETELSLADIVSGGSGFGTVCSLIGLDPGTGRYSPIDWESRSAKHNYSLVPDSKFVDGVFVPDGGSEGSIIISSAKDTFQCPDTTGEYTYGIVVYAGDIKKLHDSIPLASIPQAVFDGHQYLNDEIVMIHSNAGISFDLAAIRQSLPGLDLTSFKAFGGITESLRNTKTGLPEADFWVVVDGQIRYEKKALTIEDGRVSFDVELSPEDRFLTLIVTDGCRPAEVPKRALWNNDYFYLVDPKFQIDLVSD